MLTRLKNKIKQALTSHFMKSPESLRANRQKANEIQLAIYTKEYES